MTVAASRRPDVKPHKSPSCTMSKDEVSKDHLYSNDKLCSIIPERAGATCIIDKMYLFCTYKRFLLLQKNEIFKINILVMGYGMLCYMLC